MESDLRTICDIYGQLMRFTEGFRHFSDKSANILIWRELDDESRSDLRNFIRLATDLSKVNEGLQKLCQLAIDRNMTEGPRVLDKTSSKS